VKLCPQIRFRTIASTCVGANVCVTKPVRFSAPKRGKQDKRGNHVVRLTCFNCDSELETPRLFCSELCSQEAALVRYVRRCREDGRHGSLDVREAIQIRMAHILGGGYPERERQLSNSIRLQVFIRDNGICQACGKPGTEIDHIHGNSGALQNLQLLCNTCHVKKTKASMAPLSEGSEDFSQHVSKLHLMIQRFEAVRPHRLCDDHRDWPTQWARLFRERVEIFRRVATKSRDSGK
jgi:5-methylcytosine-specific restriction endonuclease McrA